MAHHSKQELVLHDPEGNRIEFQREDSTVTIYVFDPSYRKLLELDAVDRRALMALLNMGEYRELSYGEAR